MNMTPFRYSYPQCPIYNFMIRTTVKLHPEQEYDFLHVWPPHCVYFFCTFRKTCPYFRVESYSLWHFSALRWLCWFTLYCNLWDIRRILIFDYCDKLWPVLPNSTKFFTINFFCIPISSSISEESDVFLTCGSRSSRKLLLKKMCQVSRSEFKSVAVTKYSTKKEEWNFKSKFNDKNITFLHCWLVGNFVINSRSLLIEQSCVAVKLQYSGNIICDSYYSKSKLLHFICLQC